MNKLTSIFAPLALTVLALLVSTSAKADCVFASPAEISEFAVGTMLNWSTELERSNKEFIIERSTDGKSFNQVGTVDAIGDSELFNDYRFLDATASKGKYYYRLIAIDFDGFEVFSPVTVFNRQISNDLVITSMSATSRVERMFEVVLNSNVQDATVAYTVSKMNGELVLTEEQAITKGENVVLLDLSGLDVNRYEVAIQLNGETEAVTINKTGIPLVPVNFADTELKLKKVQKKN